LQKKASGWYNCGMEVLHWLHYLDAFEGLIVTLGLLLTAYTIHKDERARRIANLLAIHERYDHLWSRLFTNPELQRILKKDVDVNRQPVSDEEALFVKMLFLHLDTVRRATREGMFVKLQGLKADVKDFMALPIPKLVWEQMKPFQDNEFVAFVEGCLRQESN
jgi:hypothetical protein